MAAFKTHNFLPEIFRTDTNKKFLNATMDQLISEPNFKKVSGYIGRKFAPTYKSGDGYVAEDTAERQHYQVEPGVVVTDPSAGTTNFYAGYTDLVNKIGYYGGNTDDHSRLFENEVYSYSGKFDFDKFVNFSQYYWLPNGPDAVTVSATGVPMSYTWDVHLNAGAGAYYFNTASSSIGNPDITLAYGGVYKFNVDGTTGPFWIQSLPNVYGHDPQRTNIDVRQVFGVEDNGATTGTVTFKVPQKTTQDKFVGAPVAQVDYATKLQYRDIQGVDLATFNAVYGGLDGASGNIHNRKIIFVGFDNIDDYSWTDVTTLTIVPQAQRTMTWTVTVDNAGIISIAPTMVINQNEKVYVKSGAANATKEFYVDFYNLYAEVPLITANLDTLYYQSGNIATAFGTIKLVDSVFQEVNPDLDIVGKVAYTSPNGVTFSNGLKVKFDSSAVLAYKEKSFYVTGVGSSIKLIPIENMAAVERWSDSEVVANQPGINYQVHDLLTVVGGTFTTPATLQVKEVSDTGAIVKFQVVNEGVYTILPTNPVITTGGHGTGAYFNLVLQPATQDYLTINRASIDLNAWSRSNRWFHVDIIKTAAELNGNDFIIDQTLQAKRPIIEFQKDIQLFNHGVVGKTPINVLDTVVTSAYTQIENAPTNNPYLFVKTIGTNTVTYRHNDRIIFSNDSSQLVRSKVYNFYIINVSNDPFIPVYIASIVEASDAVIEAGNAVIAKSNTNVDKEFWYNGTAWVTGQQKLTTNQAPLFDVFNEDGISFGDKSYYSNTSFIGCKIFSYKLGAGTNDTVLGFPLSYRSFNNVGDIQFANHFDSDSFDYLIGPVTHTMTVNTGVMHVTTSLLSFNTDNGWTNTKEKTKQYQLISYTADGVNNLFEIDILPEASTVMPDVKVLVNGKYLAIAQYGLTQIGIRYAVLVDSKLLSKDDSVDILIYSKTVSNLGFYQVPTNLDNNAVNENFTTLTLGQMRNHLITLYNNSLDVTGVVPGNSNLRDIDIKPQGGSILKHSAPLIYSKLFLIDGQMNFVDAIRLAQREYSKFKNKFLELSTTFAVDASNIPAEADKIIKMINGIKNITFPWYYSDMVPQGDNKTVLAPYTVLDPRVKTYEITSIFNDTVLSNKAVLVYLTRTTNNQTMRTQLAKDRDFTFSTTFPGIVIADSFNLNYNDILTIVEYSNTDGNYVPETPTKLGLYPKFVPSKYTDVSFVNPIDVIQGHDGSITPAFNDYRDDLLLELELRIYNNIKVAFKFDSMIEHMPGKFRATDYTKAEYTQVLTNSFLSWAGTNRLDFTTNKFFSSNNPWTWNYKNFRDTVDGGFLPGSWRAVFLWLYDTMRPHTHPWEMLGFSDKPNWWQDRYGPAPYTGGNLTMWADLEQGLIYGGPRAGIDKRYARPGLTKLIPVDDAGNLLSPEKYAVLDFDSNKANASFSVGDIGPAEAAWYRSSDYAFAVQIAMALTKPAQYFGLYHNVDRYNKDPDLKQYVVTTSHQHLKPTMIEVNSDTTRTAGYINWISDHLKNLGISDPQTKIKTYLKNLTVQLNYKVGGYTDKKFLKVLAEQGSPSSTNTSIVIPDENYNIILNKSVPISKLTYSAVIVEKSANGYTVSGYDLTNPYFTIVPSYASNSAYTITAGKATATIYKDYQAVLVPIAYGYEFNNTQQVVDFLVSYQRYLQSQGFIFIDYDYDLGTKKDWVLSAKEFLTWAQQGWQPGNVLVLSPVKEMIRVSSTNAVVDEITNTPYGSKLLDPQFATIKSTNFSVVRDGNDFSVNSFKGQTIAFAELSLVQYEHVILFDNTTVFNDVIYSSESGNRQYRLKFVGYKTANWTGVLNPPGFIYNSTVVDDWATGKDYRKGQLVKYKDLYYTALDNVVASTDFNNVYWQQIDQTQIKTGLLPNYANSAKTFETIYDIDNQPYNETTNFYSNGLIGYRERGYLTDLLFETDTQAKFYQGYIKQKGTLNAVTALSAAELNSSTNQISVYEEWALRVGEYGATDSNHYAEVILSDLDITSNPSAIQMLTPTSAPKVGATAYRPADLYKASKNNSPDMFDIYQTNAGKPGLPTAGYPHLDDIDATIFDITNYRDLGTSMPSIGAGFTIWTAKDFTGNWNVYRVSETGNAVISLTYNMDNIATVTTSLSHRMLEGDVIAIKGFSVTVNDTKTTYDGFYQVYSVIDNLNFTIVLTTGYTTLQKANVITDNAILFKLTSSRLKTVAEITDATPLYGWKANDYVWVDDASSAGWGVYQHTNPWTYTTKALLNNSEYTGNDLFGQSIKVSKNKQFMYVGASANNTGTNTGRAASFVKQTDGSWLENNTFTNSSNGTAGFGEVVELNDRAFIVGAKKSYNNTGYVFVYGITDTGIHITQILTAEVPNSPFNLSNNFGPGFFEDLHTNGKFGHSIATSSDGNWLYISEPGQNKIYAYAWKKKTAHVQTVAGGTAAFDIQAQWASNVLSATDILITGNVPYVPGVDYQLNHNAPTTAPNVSFYPGHIPTETLLVSYGSCYTLAGIITDVSLSPDAMFGSYIACNADGSQIVVGASNDNDGSMYVFNRSIETFFARGNNNTFTPPALRSIQDIYRVSVNDVEQTNGIEYVISSGSIQFISTLAPGSKVNIETNYFTQVTKVNSSISLSNQQFGAIVEISDDASGVYAGAPNYTTDTYRNGAVYRYTNAAKIYGTILGTVANPTVTVGHSISINGVDVPFIDITLDSVVGSINGAGIPGVRASNEGNKLRITSTLTDTNKLTILPGVGTTPYNGTAIDDLGLVLYKEAQIIVHPIHNDVEFFGTAIKISTDNHTLAVSSDGAKTISHFAFDNSDTNFDSGSTGFYESYPNSGAVYIFDLIDDPLGSPNNLPQFQYTQELQALHMDANVHFGAAIEIEIQGNSIYVGLSTDSATGPTGKPGGSVVEFTNYNSRKGWNLRRTATPQTDYEGISKLYIYNKNTKNILTRLDVYDPAKGKILGVADQDIDFKSEQDPAVYNYGGTNDSFDFHWSNLQLGKVWWDLSTVRFIEYEQDTLEYKNKHWGATFPGSTFNVYEWVESDYVPSDYVANNPTGSGTPKYADNSNYVTYAYVDHNTGVIKSKYYYWVGGKTTVDVNITKRTNSVYTIQQILSNPKEQGIAYAAAIATNAVSLFNIVPYLSGQSVVLHIDHSPVKNTNIIHTEYELIKENAENEPIPQRLVNKLQDSLAGINFAGHTVPDPNLGVADRYGIEIRPRQTMFVNRLTALENFVKYINNIFTTYPVANLRNLSQLNNGEAQPIIGVSYDKKVASKDELGYLTAVATNYKVLVDHDSDHDGLWTIYNWTGTEWILVRIQSYLTSLYFSYVDWYDASYDYTTKPTYTVATYPSIGALTLVEGNTVRVNDDGTGRFAIYKVNADLTLTQVGSQNGTIQILPTLYDLSAGNMGFDNDNFDTIRFDQNPILETRDVFSAVVDSILIADLQLEFNKLFFSLVNYIFTEQAAPDWIFKTSFISVIHKIRDLAQYPSYIKDNQTYYESYINEVKPYRTSIREYLPTQSAIDYLHAGVTDFDLPSYYDTISNTYRSPNGDYATDDNLLATDPKYIDWNNNHTYKIVEMAISSAGSEYTLRPEIIITGGGGTGAVAIAEIANGAIVNIVMVNTGLGYTSSPTVTVNGNGNGAILVPVLRTEFKTNAAISYNTVRSIETELKFDRIKYDSYVVEWEPNTAYTANLGISHTLVGAQMDFKDTSGNYIVTHDSFGTEFKLVYQSLINKDTVWINSGNLVTYEGKIYCPLANANVTTETTFDASMYDLVDAGNILITNNDRIMGYYTPGVGMPGKSLTQLVNGIEYPGVNVFGNTYLANASPVDSTITSSYIDSTLGFKPEDINVDGGAYYDTFSSHAPEELMPGRIYETLDIQVLQCNTYSFSSNAFSITSVTLLDGGFGYDDIASKAFKASQGIDVTSITPIAVTINGILAANITPILAANGAITSMTINNGGYGITSNANPTIVITGSNVAPAKATAHISQSLYDPVGWREYYDMNGIIHYRRIGDAYKTTLTQPLSLTDTLIHVANANIVSSPDVTLAKPGEIFINGEKITYYTVDLINNTLGQIRRATGGTGAPAMHASGSTVEDAGVNQIIPHTSIVPTLGYGSPESFIGDGTTTLFETVGIYSIYPDNVTVTIDGNLVKNYKVTNLTPLAIEFLEIGNPAAPDVVDAGSHVIFNDYMQAAPPNGSTVVISGLVETLWENVLDTVPHQLMFGPDQWIDESGDYMTTAAPAGGAVTDGLGLMGSNSVQAKFIKSMV